MRGPVGDFCNSSGWRQWWLGWGSVGGSEEKLGNMLNLRCLLKIQVEICPVNSLEFR